MSLCLLVFQGLNWAGTISLRFCDVTICCHFFDEYPEKAWEFDVSAPVAFANFFCPTTVLLLLYTNQVFNGLLPYRNVSDLICPISD